MEINDILNELKIKTDRAEDNMEGADSNDFIFFGEQLSCFIELSRELKMILFSTNGRNLEDFIPRLRGRVEAINEVINLIKK